MVDDARQELDKIIGKLDQVLTAQAASATQQANMQCDITEIKQQVKETNGTVKNHETRVSVLEDWRKTAAAPTIQDSAKSVSEMKIELARLAIKYGGVAGGVTMALAVAFALLKLFNVI